MKTNQEMMILSGLDNGVNDQQIKYYKQTINVNIHHYYIIEEIEGAEKYLDLINTLKTAEQHDTIIIYLNTPGGNLGTAMQIINAMRQSQATVITCIEGEVYSAGTLIFLSGSKYIVSEHSAFMAHDYSFNPYGKGSDISRMVGFSKRYVSKIYNDIYSEFLTQEEINAMLNDGKEIWLDGAEVMQRLGIKPDETVSDLINSATEAVAEI